MTNLTNNTNAFDDAVEIYSHTWSILDVPYSYLMGYSLLDYFAFLIVFSLTIAFIYRIVDTKAGAGLTSRIMGDEPPEPDLEKSEKEGKYQEMHYQSSIEGATENWNWRD